jgi:isoleucyl-tRNA synthetase
MRSVRAVCSATLSLREAHRLRTRLPLRALTVAGSRAQELAAYSELIADEVNVKSVVLHQDENRLMRRDLRLNFRKLGPKLGQNMQAVAAAVRSGDFELLAAGRARVAGFELEPDEFELSVGPAPGVVGNLLASEQLLVVLDVTLTPELEREGLVRDLVRVVQEARKRHQLHVSDRVRLVFDAPLTVTSAARAHLQYLADQTLAVDVSFDAGADVELEQVTVAGMSIGIAVLRAEV